MDKPGRALGKGIAIGAIGLLIAAASIALVLIYTGAFNVAATEEHASLTRWAFDTTFHRSVRGRAADINAPENFTTEMVEAGAGEYKSMCQHCHGGPGVERDEWASGMRPQPPHLTEEAPEWAPEEIFWIAKHGVKMTGMPAFGPTHADQTLWNIVAIVKELPAMTPERYAALGGEHGHDNHENSHDQARNSDGEN